MRSVVNIKSHTHYGINPVTLSPRTPPTSTHPLGCSVKPTEIDAVAECRRPAREGKLQYRRHDNCSTIVCPHGFPFRPYLGPELLYISTKPTFPLSLSLSTPTSRKTLLPQPHTRLLAVFTAFRTMHTARSVVALLPTKIHPYAETRQSKYYI